MKRKVNRRISEGVQELGELRGIDVAGRKLRKMPNSSKTKSEAGKRRLFSATHQVSFRVERCVTIKSLD